MLILIFSDACRLPPAASATPPEHLELVPAPLELLPEPLDLHAYLWNTSGPKWMVKIRYVTKTHPRSSSCLANPVTEPLVSSEEALLTSWYARRKSYEAFTSSWDAQPRVGPAWSRASRESGEPVVSSASAYRHHPEPECPRNISSEHFPTT